MVLVDSHRISRVPWYSGYPAPSFDFRLQVFHLLRIGFPAASTSLQRLMPGPTTPKSTPKSQFRFGLFPFRSPLLRKSIFLSLPSGTEMVHFPEFASYTLYIQVQMTPISRSRVPPFGNPRVIVYLQLTEAYRSLPRPSSPLRTKASTVHP